MLAVYGRVYDATHTPAGLALDRFWVVHHLDLAAPDALRIESPQDVVGVGQTLVTGSAHDESGVTQVRVEVQMPGTTTLLSCPPPRASDGRWACPWDVTATNGGIAPADGAQITLRVQATDRFGHSAWSTAETLVVDATPPTVTVDMSGIKVYPGNVVHRTSGLGGEVADAHGVGGVEGCADEVCKTADLQASGSGATRWYITRPDDILRDHVARRVTISAVDALGNRTPEPVSFTLYVDDVAPVITANQAMTHVLLGSTHTVLSGTVTDGGSVNGMWVRMQAPDGSQSLTAVHRDGDGWSFDLTAHLPGQYVLQVEAVDEADNTSIAGPYVVTVDCTNAGPVVVALVAQADTAAPLSQTLTVRIGNTGPELLPAGMPMAIYAGQQRLWAAATTAPLAPGAQQTTSVQWTVDSLGDYEMSVLLNNTPTGPADPQALTLCRVPAGWHQVVRVGEAWPVKWYFPSVYR